LRGDETRNKPQEPAEVTLSLPLEAAEALHATLEDLLEGRREDVALERAYRVLAWRILAVRGGPGLTAHMAKLARQASSVEEYEAARDRALGPILDGLESAENRDP
jgi:hypothetical protein